MKQRKTKLNTGGIEGKEKSIRIRHGCTKREQRPQQGNGICVKGQLQLKDALLLNKLGSVGVALQFCCVASHLWNNPENQELRQLGTSYTVSQFIRPQQLLSSNFAPERNSADYFLLFSQSRCWRIRSCGMWRRVLTDVSNNSTAYSGQD